MVSKKWIILGGLAGIASLIFLNSQKTPAPYDGAQPAGPTNNVAGSWVAPADSAPIIAKSAVEIVAAKTNMISLPSYSGAPSNATNYAGKTSRSEGSWKASYAGTKVTNAVISSYTSQGGTATSTPGGGTKIVTAGGSTIYYS